ncbi:hypothetical protein C7476_12242 [Phyllobacterium bourgognense]|uniref:Uncharacterized protein n=1 Tax=Phyllobacterium bourgognense TaxID=314236 RepID=A0A368YES4_9HYPH|nr:hypothetical protein C7476_12242 [Phyllobacterium bourgognense]
MAVYGWSCSLSPSDSLAVAMTIRADPQPVSKSEYGTVVTAKAFADGSGNQCKVCIWGILDIFCCVPDAIMLTRIRVMHSRRRMNMSTKSRLIFVLTVLSIRRPQINVSCSTFEHAPLEYICRVSSFRPRAYGVGTN